MHPIRLRAAQYTHGNTSSDSRRYKTDLPSAFGLGRGSHIAVLSETRPEYVETYAACAALGVMVVALNIRLHPEELLHCLEKAKPSLLISSGPLTPLVASLRDRISYLKDWIALDPTDGWLDYGGLLATASADEPPRVADGAT
jgi:acyl-CoA synthetase (AMP-forming)/AMP-acid ligase II